MKKIFADTHYWVALFNEKDEHHEQAIALASQIQESTIVTSDMVLCELLNTFSRGAADLKKQIANFVEDLLQSQECLVIEQSRSLFIKALDTYSHRGDKHWGFTDCASYYIMKTNDITEVLTYDRHFQQMGFKALLREK